MDVLKLAERFLQFALSFFCHREKHRGEGISVIIPFRSSHNYPRQDRNFRWLKKYYAYQLPGAEVIVGHDHRTDLSFSKSAAVNDGVRKSTGDILVIVDADGYVPIEAILFCAHEIRRARSRGHRLWYVPYRQFYRLTHHASLRVLNSSPRHPYQFPTPPDKCDIQNTSGSGHGHWYGALVQIVPREAFDCVGGWDHRFRGWGGEDHSIMRATDTLYCHHKTLPGQVLHLWHPMLGTDGVDSWVEWKDRLWDNQDTSGTNNRLATRYSKANGDVARMRALVDEGQ